MKENLKSFVIGLAALAALILWLCFQPKPPADWSQKGVGEIVFPNFQDAADARSVTITRPKIVSADSDSPAGTDVLTAVREKDGWVIRTADGAPADDPSRLTMILAPLLRLTVLAEVPEIDASAGEHRVTEFHRQCRLLDPTNCGFSDLKNAGIRLTVTGEEGAIFADFLIGDVPEGSSAVRDIRYLRFPGENRVWTVDFSGETVEKAGEEKAPLYVDRLSTDPLDWMNRDLLRTSRWNIARMTLFAYQADADGTMTPKQYLALAQDPERSLGRVWELIRRIDYDSDAGAAEWPVTDENRFPDNGPLNMAADALCHMTFIEIRRKPDALAELLTANRPAREWIPFTETLKPLGFYFVDHNPLDPESVDPQGVGVGGEAILTMTDGTELRLLFGVKDDQNRRTLFVIPSFNAEFFPKPDPLPIPEGADEEEKKRLTDENRIAENEYALNMDEGQKKARAFGRRFDHWFYLIDEETYQKIFSFSVDP